MPPAKREKRRQTTGEQRNPLRCNFMNAVLLYRFAVAIDDAYFSCIGSCSPLHASPPVCDKASSCDVCFLCSLAQSGGSCLSLFPTRYLCNIGGKRASMTCVLISSHHNRKIYHEESEDAEQTLTLQNTKLAPSNRVPNTKRRSLAWSSQCYPCSQCKHNTRGAMHTPCCAPMHALCRSKPLLHRY